MNSTLSVVPPIAPSIVRLEPLVFWYGTTTGQSQPENVFRRFAHMFVEVSSNQKTIFPLFQRSSISSMNSNYYLFKSSVFLNLLMQCWSTLRKVTLFCLQQRRRVSLLMLMLNFDCKSRTRSYSVIAAWLCKISPETNFLMIVASIFFCLPLLDLLSRKFFVRFHFNKMF